MPQQPDAQARYSRYAMFIDVVEEGSFTKVANRIGYTQSAVSQTVSRGAQRGLLHARGPLLPRRLTLTKTVKFMPYLQAVARDRRALAEAARKSRAWGAPPSRLAPSPA